MYEEDQLEGWIQGIWHQDTETGFAVLTVKTADDEAVSVIGPLAGLCPGERVSLSGRYEENMQYGRQFRAQDFTIQPPEEPEHIRIYLKAALPDADPVLIDRLVEALGDETLELLAGHPDEAAARAALSPKTVRKLSDQYLKVYGAHETLAELSRLGIPSAAALKIYRLWNTDAPARIEQNPYLLCEEPLALGMQLAEAIAERFGFDRQGGERARGALLTELRRTLATGSTCLPYDKLATEAARGYGLDAAVVGRQLEGLCEQHAVRQVLCNGEAVVFLPMFFEAESAAADDLRRRAKSPQHPGSDLDARIRMLETAEGITYDERQRQAIREALTRQVLVITGGPGTGKTTTIRAILELFNQQADSVLLAAPTGRAAKRMSQLTRREASTLHRLLEAKAAGDTTQFARNAKNPLRCDVLVVDEMSMVDTVLFASLLDALPANCRLILLGDIDQLPSVGPGCVLKDILKSAVVPSVRLTRGFRQEALDGLIVENAARVAAGEMPLPGGPDKDYEFRPLATPLVAEEVCRIVEQLRAELAAGDEWDVQVLCPSQKGRNGTRSLNELLRERLNPAVAHALALRVGGRELREGDRVIQTKNNYDVPYTSARRDGAGIFNGDIGAVVQLDPRAGQLVVECDGRLYEYEAPQAADLDFAYAITVHKSQGNEFDTVVLPLAGVPQLLQYRSLFYTALTRARRRCIVLGSETELRRMVETVRDDGRFSCFTAFLRGEVEV